MEVKRGKNLLQPVEPPRLEGLHLFFMLFFPIAFVLFVSLYIYDIEVYKAISKEGIGFVQIATAFLLFTTSIFSGALVLRVWKKENRLHIFFILFGAFCMWAFLEEISFGQRLFEIEPPQFFVDHSSQPEINVHNLLQEQLRFKTKHFAAYTLLIWGVLFPYLLKYEFIRNLFDRFWFVVPPQSLILGFLFGAVLAIDWPTGREEEVEEFFFSICFIFTLWYEHAIFTAYHKDLKNNYD